MSSVRTTFDASSDERVQGEGDIYWTRHTERCARTAAGTACEAALAVATGTCDRAFAVVRPPGHHADCGRATGFCFFNNAAVAARVALERGAARRCSSWIGTCTTATAFRISSTKTLGCCTSLCIATATDFIPGRGRRPRSARRWEGFNVNIPWEEKGLGDADYLAAFDLVVDPVAKVSTRISSSPPRDSTPRRAIRWGMRVSDQGYALMTERLLRLANGRRAAALEGDTDSRPPRTPPPPRSRRCSGSPRRRSARENARGEAPSRRSLGWWLRTKRGGPR